MVYYPPNPVAEERIRRLEEELYCARRDIIDLMSPEVTKLLTSYYSCNSEREYYEWWHDTIDTIVSMAEIDPKASYLQDRGWCPLCKGGSMGPYDSGFTLPEGLKRHLSGFGNTHQCPVTRAAFHIARHALRETFEASREAAQRKVEERRRTERVFMTDPSSSPQLCDEHLWSGKPRSADELAAAEDRLRGLNFQIEVNDNVVAYKFCHEHFLVLADPRTAGRIEFRVFDSERPKRRARTIETFHLLDTWKNDLPAKFRERLSEACARLAPQRPRAVAARKRPSSPPSG